MRDRIYSGMISAGDILRNSKLTLVLEVTPSTF